MRRRIRGRFLSRAGRGMQVLRRPCGQKPPFTGSSAKSPFRHEAVNRTPQAAAKVPTVASAPGPVDSRKPQPPSPPVIGWTGFAEVASKTEP
jgi:hypothetical protein